MWGAVRTLVLGTPLPTARMHTERVGLLGGLAVFASDALSSVAYGTEEVLIMLVLAGTMGLPYAVPVTVAIVALISIVATSYRQTVVEYPSGGGAYVVARDNLGPWAANTAAAALLADYVLTVAVSVTAGVAAITSAFPALLDESVFISVICVLFVMMVNLRGVRESAAAFAVPVYLFVLCVLALVAWGLCKSAAGWHGTVGTAPSLALVAGQPLTAFLVLRAFSSGCAALTGIEAVANGVQAFKPPSGPRAATVLAVLATILGVSTLGVAILARHLHSLPTETETVLSQIGRQVFGVGPIYYLLQATTAIILILAANTSFAGFPRLAAFLADDKYLPRQFSTLGNRLVYSNGIIVLAVVACALIVLFGGTVTRLIPLYAVGVFTAFTLSQTGMVRHWFRQRGAGWRMKAIVNGVGAVVTGIVLFVVGVTKFVHGAWLVCVFIPLAVLAFQQVRRHYLWVADNLRLPGKVEAPALRNLNLLLVGGLNRGLIEGLRYLKSLSGDACGVHVATLGQDNSKLEAAWKDLAPGIRLSVLASPYRDIAGPLLDFIEAERARRGYDVVTVILPEFTVRSWWESVLHNHTAFWLQFVLRNAPGVAVANMRYKL